MKKGLKISLISIGSILVLLLLTISIITWLVFTPAKLTPIVRNQMSKFITCQSKIGEVELTFFSTFPEFGIKINGMSLINPLQGAPSDTLLNSESAVAALDFNALWNRNELILKDLKLNKVSINAFVDKNGKTNYDIMVTDTTKKDTSAFKNPFTRIDFQKIALNNANITYTNLTSKMWSKMAHVNGNVKFVMKGTDIDVELKVSTPDISFRMDTIDYLKNASINIEAPIQFKMKESLLTMQKAQVTFNGLHAELDGQVQNRTNGDIFTDLKFNTLSYRIKPLLAMLPPVYTTSLKGIMLDGSATANGKVAGIYNSKQMPIIDVLVYLKDGSFAYNGLAMKLSEMAGNANIHLNMNQAKGSKVIINEASCKMGQSTIEGKGLVDYILDKDMLFDLDLKAKMQLSELKPMIPKDIPVQLDGLAEGTAKTRFMLSDAMNMKLDKMNISGKFNASNLSIVYDTITAHADNAKLDLTIPNKKGAATSFMKAGIWCNQLAVHQGKHTEVTLHNANLLALTSNLMEMKRMNTVKCQYSFDKMNASMDKTTAHISNAKGDVNIMANFSDTIHLPKVNCTFDVQDFIASMDTMSVNIAYPKGSFALNNEMNHPEKIMIDLKYNGAATLAKMGSKQSVSAQQLATYTHIIYNSKEKNALLQWIPTGFINMTQGKITVNGLNANIQIPTIQFNYTPDEYDIKDSKFIVNNSDFRLIGKLSNVQDYLNNKGLLKGNFDFTSNKTDVYQLMQLTNGFGAADTLATENTIETTSKTPTGPYMVPKGIDLVLHAKVNKALLGYDSAQNVLGEITLKNGLLALENLRFKTHAADMELSAMYRSPRRNHLFTAFDFHIMNTQIKDLLQVIPNLDTIMPMLKSFDGKGEFHIAAETNLDSMYNLKKSTLKGVCSIKGENLVLMDGETFSEIAKKLMFSKKTKNKVDSLSTEFTIFRNEVDIYPFQIVMDKYKAVVSGRHNLDMSFDYHISVTDSPLPFRLGVDVKGTMDKMKISLAKCRYANLYRPAQRKEIDKRQLEIKRMIREALIKQVTK